MRHAPCEPACSNALAALVPEPPLLVGALASLGGGSPQVSRNPVTLVVPVHSVCSSPTYLNARRTNKGDCLLVLLAMGGTTAPQTLEVVVEGYHGQLPALIVAEGGPTLTRSDLRQHVQQLGLRLRAAGIQPGEVISTAFGNSLECVVSFLGATNARAVAAPLNAAYKQVG